MESKLAFSDVIKFCGPAISHPLRCLCCVRCCRAGIDSNVAQTDWTLIESFALVHESR